MAANQVSQSAYAPIPVEPASVTIPARKTVKAKKTVSSRKRSFSIFPEDIRKRTIRKNAWKRLFKKSRSDVSQTMQGFDRNVIRPVGSFFKKLLAVKPQSVRSTTRLTTQPAAHRTISPVLSPTPLPRKRLGRKMHDSIRLVGREEMRCPYCLQVVERKDPHGIVICPICKSAHHKECWDITGSCQVPHNHAVL